MTFFFFFLWWWWWGCSVLHANRAATAAERGDFIFKKTSMAMVFKLSTTFSIVFSFFFVFCFFFNGILLCLWDFIMCWRSLSQYENRDVFVCLVGWLAYVYLWVYLFIFKGWPWFCLRVGIWEYLFISYYFC